jgi:signal transduction histidine kinase
MTARKGIRIPWSLASSGKKRRELQGFVSGLASRALGILDLPERKSFLEDEIKRTFDFRRAEILVRPEGSERFSTASTRVRDLLARVLGVLDGIRRPFLNQAVTHEIGASALLGHIEGTYAFAIRQGGKSVGILVLDTSPVLQLDPELEQIIQTICEQIAMVLENSSLLRGKLELERTIAQQSQMVQLGEMTARMAHEIKNPLSSIKTIIQVMQEDPEVRGRYERDLELIQSEVDRLASSVMQLLNFARPSPVLREAVRLHEVAEGVVQFLQRDIQKTASIVLNEIPQTLSPVTGNSSIFREILLNLILNAIQAGGAGTRIVLKAREEPLEIDAQRFALLVVEDDGPGVDPAVQPKVFAPFFTTRQRGTGLGLSIVRRHVEHLGGEIRLESPVRDGRGARFLMHLPLHNPGVP